MDADDFWNTVLDPQRRTVIRVHLDDAEKKLRHTLFGGPPGRRSWMAEVAAVVDTLALDPGLEKTNCDLDPGRS